MALTWKTVSAPDFQGSMDALKTQQELLNKGLSGLTGAVQGFQTARENRASEQLAQISNQFEDPDAYAAAVRSGQATQGIDSDLVTSKLLEAAKAREGTLRTQQTEQAKRAVPGLQNQVFDLAQSGKTPEEINAFITENLNTFIQGGSQLANRDFATTYVDNVIKQKTTRENAPILDALGQYVAVGDVNAAKTLVNAYSNRIPAEALAKVTPIIDKHTVDQLIPQFTGSLKDTLGKATETYNSLTPGQKPLFAAAYNKLVGTNAIGDSANDVETAAKIAAGEPLTPLGGTLTTNATGSNEVEAGSAYADRVGLNTKESSNRTDAKNDAIGSSGKKGHFGLLQFSQDRLADAKAAGVIRADMTPEEYLRTNKEFQNKVADWHFADIDKQATKAGIEDYYGTTIKGVTINRDSVRAMAHLGGMGGLMDFIKSGGKKDYEDVNGTKISDYGRRFGGGVPDQATQLASAVVPKTGLTPQEIERKAAASIKAPVEVSLKNRPLMSIDRSAVNKASEVLANTAGIPPAAASTGAESIPPRTNEENTFERVSQLNATQLSNLVNDTELVMRNTIDERNNNYGNYLPSKAAKAWGESNGEIAEKVEKRNKNVTPEKWQEILDFAKKDYPNLTNATVAEAFSTARLNTGFWEEGVPFITWLNEIDAVNQDKLKANLETANKAVATSTLANASVGRKVEQAKKYAEQFTKAEQQLKEAQLMATSMGRPDHPLLKKAQERYNNAKRDAAIAATSLSTSM